MDQETVWITGASSGIGEALAYEFAARGAYLIVSGRREDALAAVADTCARISGTENNTKLVVFDAADMSAIDGAVESALSATGRIDTLLNNAGISQRGLAVDTTMETYRTLFEVDVFGPIALTKAVLPIMIEQKSGHIAITASVAGKIGAPERTGYCAAKHAMMGFFDALRAEMQQAQTGIKVTTITPGFIRTHISDNALTGDGSRFGRTDDNIKGGMDVTSCAKVIMRGFDRGKYEIAVGKGMEMHALWLKRLFPTFIMKTVAKVANPS